MNIKKEIELLNNELEEIKKKGSLINEKIKYFKSQCEHEELEVSDFDTATCLICGAYFSWYCPTSPTLECDFEQEDGSYDGECCRYCGGPEERK